MKKPSYKDKAPVFRAVRAYGRGRPVRFHTPGHKGKAGAVFRASFDVTELNGTDSLSEPAGCFLDAQAAAAEFYGAEAVYFSVNGSTHGLLAGFHALRSLGVKRVIIERSAHQSVYNACELFGLEPELLPARYCDGLPLPASVEDVECAANNSPEAGAVLITSPDYYGRCASVREIAAFAKKSGLYFLCDQAHGAHFPLHVELKDKSAAGLADLCVCGAHKTLGAPTQAAFIACNGAFKAAVADSLRLLTTSSPSYILTAGLDLARSYAQIYVCKYERIAAFSHELMSMFPDVLVKTDDFSRIVLDARALGLTGFQAGEYFLSRKTVPEFSSFRHVVIILTAFDGRREFRRLRSCLRGLVKYAESLGKSGGGEAKAANAGAITAAPDRKMSYLAAVTAPSETVAFEAAAGRIAAVNAGLTPPRTPLIVAGEVISADAARLLSAAQSRFGTDGDGIRVVKNTLGHGNP